MRAGVRDDGALWKGKRLSAEELITALSGVELVGQPGESFEYDNVGLAVGIYLGVLAAGGEHGKLFDDYAQMIQSHVLDPIGMTRTTVDAFEAMSNHAHTWPHFWSSENEHVPAEQFLEGNSPGDGIISAGGMASNVQDMARFLITQLNRGISPSGTRIVSEEILEVIWKSQSPPITEFIDKAVFPSSFVPESDAQVEYGMGWFIGHYRGISALVDPGNQQGYTNVMSLLPEANVGVVILSNADILPCAYGLTTSVQYRLTELLYGMDNQIDNIVNGALKNAGIECSPTVEKTNEVKPYTPPITGPTGEKLDGSIATLERVTLGGIDQSIVIRGYDLAKPVLLVLHGGPEFAMTPWLELYQRPELEKHFVVVNWDQRGAGKSYSESLTADDMRIENFVSNTLELTEFLQNRFNQEKIFLTGHSWGSGLDFLTIMEEAEPFHAYIASGEAAHWNKRQNLSYEWVLEQAQTAGDSKIVAELMILKPFVSTDIEHIVVRNQFLDRYRGGDLYTVGFWGTYVEYVMTGKSPMYTPAEAKSYLSAREYTVKTVLPQLAKSGYDLFKRFPKSSIPIHFFAGRHDHLTPGVLAESYYEALEAPSKSFVWFEESAHTLMFDEPDKWAMELIKIAQSALSEK